MGLRNQAKKYGYVKFIYLRLYLLSILTLFRATLMEGTVTSLLANADGNIVGVGYRDKQAGCTKVSFSITLFKLLVPCLSLTCT
jgi:deoxycytidylate deaminase